MRDYNTNMLIIIGRLLTNIISKNALLAAAHTMGVGSGGQGGRGPPWIFIHGTNIVGMG